MCVFCVCFIYILTLNLQAFPVLTDAKVKLKSHHLIPTVGKQTFLVSCQSPPTPPPPDHPLLTLKVPMFHVLTDAKIKLISSHLIPIFKKQNILISCKFLRHLLPYHPTPIYLFSFLSDKGRKCLIRSKTTSSKLDQLKHMVTCTKATSTCVCVVCGV